MNQSCYGLFTKSEYSQPLIFLMIACLIEQFQRVAYGSVFDTITTSTFKSTIVVMPPIEVINEIKSYVNPIFDLMLSNTQENSKLAQIRDALLPKLILGEIEVKAIEKEVSQVI